MSRPVDIDFVKALPKTELHAHLTGSISVWALHELWLEQRAKLAVELPNPTGVISPGGDGEGVNLETFFPLFDEFIYRLVNDAESVGYVTYCVLKDFEQDGVAYLELRTTPRENKDTGLTKTAYVSTVNKVVADWNRLRVSRCYGMVARLLLSVDRKMSATQADEVIELAAKYKYAGDQTDGQVVGVDLCGNPTRGDVKTFTPAFRKATEQGLAITVHFAEIPNQSTPNELETLLSWQPRRLGHCINVNGPLSEIIKERKLGLELCLSCNVLASMTEGGFAKHHFGQWRETDCPIALSVRC
jgi:adenosine deaminase